MTGEIKLTLNTTLILKWKCLDILFILYVTFVLKEHCLFTSFLLF